ncbi:MAG: electron transfer flavoprotein subunit beta/FixA family protein [Planctomycetota bacterium]|nr:electron transfer flavoprotein subunit beta/FixA family protein [Planctomycetota bacterium]
MRVCVCIKRVPDTAANIRIGSDGKTIDPGGVEFVMSPYDEIAIEQALRLKESAGQGEVVVVSLGPSEAAATLRSGLAMGADRAVLLKDPMKYRDPYGVASTLAEELKKMSFDMLLFGKQAVDDDCCQVGSIVAALLGLPFVGIVTKMEVKAGTATVHRQVEGGHEVVEVKLPAAFSCQKGLAEPRLPSLKGIMASKKKPLEERSVATVEPVFEVEKLEYPPRRAPGKIAGQGAEGVAPLLNLLKTEAKIY